MPIVKRNAAEDDVGPTVYQLFDSSIILHMCVDK